MDENQTHQTSGDQAMNIGMLWFDNDNKVDLPTRIQRAASYYRTKYGRLPNLCFVHPSMVGSTPVSTNGSGIEVRTTRSVLPNHFWLGVNAPA
jgi:hypothetical protein